MAIDAIVKIYHNVPLYPGTEHYILMNNEDTFLTTLNTKYLKRTYNTVLDPRNLVTSGSIQLDGSYAEYSSCNYMYIAVQRNGQSFRRYAFITNITYTNDNSFMVEYQIDNFTSFIYQMEKSRTGYVVREHTNNDTIGANKCDEGLDTGEYLHRQIVSSQNTLGTMIIVATTKDIAGENYSGGRYNGLVNGNGLLAFNPGSEITAFQNYINSMNEKGYISAINNIFLVPYFVCTDNDKDGGTHKVNQSGTPKTFTFTGNKDYYLDGYTPKNNKLFTKPYCYCSVLNNQGGSIDLEFDLWTQTSDIEFEVNGVIAQGQCCNIYPYKYGITNTVGRNFVYTLPLGNYPSVSWQNDQYANWLAQTQNTRQNNIVQASVATGVNALTSLLSFDLQGVGNAVVNGASSISGQLASQLDHAVLPNLVQNSNSYADLNTSMGLKRFDVITNFITYQFAKRIDDYFSAFGYKTLETKQPNFYGRKNWNYLQITNYPIMGDIPNVAQQTIRGLLNNGVTLWHTFDVGNYSLDNSII